VHLLIATGEFAFAVIILATVATSVARTILIPRNRSSRMMRCALRAALAAARVAVRPGRRDGGHPRLVDLVGPIAMLGVLLGWLVGLVSGSVLLAVSVGGVRPNADAIAGLFLRAGAEQGSRPGQAVAVGTWAAAGTVIACIAGYLSTVAAAYGRRERAVRRLASQAVRPPDAEDLLAAYLRDGGIDPLLTEWDLWFSDIRTTHSAYPVLVTLPRNGDLCWLEAMVIALDTAALVDALAPSAAHPHAKALLRSGTACLGELATQLRVPVPAPLVSLQGREESDFPDTVNTALKTGLTAERTEQEAWLAFQDWRQAYAPHASAIAAHLLCYCPPHERVESSGRSNVR
jgi:hypothetical protein